MFCRCEEKLDFAVCAVTRGCCELEPEARGADTHSRDCR